MRYKTGDVCPITGDWLLEESGEVMTIVKGDKFSTYNLKRAYFRLIKSYEDDNEDTSSKT